MTSQELNEHINRIEEISIELDVILKKIQDHNTELEVLWAKYWEAYKKLTDMIDTEGGEA